MLYLVRHGRPRPDPDVPPHEWQLDPAGYDDIVALRDSGSLPTSASWYSSPEPKALETARRLTDAPVSVVADLREHVRGVTPWFDDVGEWHAVVRRAFEDPDTAALPGWERLADCRQRVARSARVILAGHAGGDVVLAGHGTAWTVLVAELTGAAPDLSRWAQLRMPDLIRVAHPQGP